MRTASRLKQERIFMKNIILVLGLTLSTFLITACDTETKTVAISQFISHQALDDTYRGIIDGLEEKGYKDGKNIHIAYENAHGNSLTATQIGTKFRSLHPQVLVGIATPASQALMRTSTQAQIPLLFGAVSDPIGAGLEGAKGVTDMIAFPPLVKRIREVFPEATTIGVIYSAGEANSITQVTDFKKAAAAENFQVIEKSVLRSTDAQAAFDSLAEKVDLVFTPTDNLIISAANVLIQRSFVHKTPIISANRDPVEKGALMAFGVDYYEQGKMIASQIIDLLKGKSIDELGILTQDQVDFFVNLKSADKLGVTIPEDVLKHAKEMY